MTSDAVSVVLAGAACLQVLLVCIEDLGHGERAALINDLARLSAGELPSGLLSLPKGQDVRRCGGFEIVAESDLLEPLGAAAVAAPNPTFPTQAKKPGISRGHPQKSLLQGRCGCLDGLASCGDPRSRLDGQVEVELLHEELLIGIELRVAAEDQRAP